MGAGVADKLPVAPAVTGGDGRRLRHTIDRAVAGERLDESLIASLLTARGEAYGEVVSAADAVRQAVSGDVMTYVVNRNIITRMSAAIAAGSARFRRDG